jgi:hypothetical protein
MCWKALITGYRRFTIFREQIWNDYTELACIRGSIFHYLVLKVVYTLSLAFSDSL